MTQMRDKYWTGSMAYIISKNCKYCNILTPIHKKITITLNDTLAASAYINTTRCYRPPPFSFIVNSITCLSFLFNSAIAVLNKDIMFFSTTSFCSVIKMICVQESVNSCFSVAFSFSNAVYFAFNCSNSTFCAFSSRSPQRKLSSADMELKITSHYHYTKEMSYIFVFCLSCPMPKYKIMDKYKIMEIFGKQQFHRIFTS